MIIQCVGGKVTIVNPSPALLALPSRHNEYIKRATYVILECARTLDKLDQAKVCLQLNTAQIEGIFTRLAHEQAKVRQSVTNSVATALCTNPCIEFQFIQLEYEWRQRAVESVDKGKLRARTLDTRVRKHATSALLGFTLAELEVVMFLISFFLAIVEAGILGGGYVDRVRGLRLRLQAAVPDVYTKLKDGELQCSIRP